MRIKERIAHIRQWILEDSGYGPPNNWESSPHYPSRGHGMSSGHEWYSLHFNNDAFEVWIATQYTDEDKSQWALAMAAEDFRKLALWYLWRWAWGEWFGLRRKLFYWWLRRHTAPMMARLRTEARQ